MRTHGSISVVVLDLDRLKEINDTYGHEAGDRALRAIGSVAASRRSARTICARASPATSSSSCSGTATPSTRRAAWQELQTAVGAHPFEPRPGVRVSLSISAGPARFPVDGTTFEELLAAADARMYRDKAGRRSRNSSPPRPGGRRLRRRLTRGRPRFGRFPPKRRLCRSLAVW